MVKATAGNTFQSDRREHLKPLTEAADYPTQESDHSRLVPGV